MGDFLKIKFPSFEQRLALLRAYFKPQENESAGNAKSLSPTLTFEWDETHE